MLLPVIGTVNHAGGLAPAGRAHYDFKRPRPDKESTMSIKAVLTDAGAPGHLVIGDVEDPAARPEEALVRVGAISLNRGEVRRAQGMPAGQRIGWDVAGVVEKAAADGSGPQEGQRVVGVLQYRAWAELVAIPSSNLAVLPDNVGFNQASTLPVAGLTALYALDRANGLTGRKVLITGASGGVGNIGIQVAVNGGAEVTALVRQERHAGSARAAGAHHVVADETGEAAREFGPYNHILESVAGEVLGNAMTMVAPGGHIVVYGVSAGGPLTVDSSVLLRSRMTISGLAVFTELHKETAAVGLGRLAAMVSAGTLKPHIAIEAPWTDIGKVALQLIERSYPGKAVLTVS
jgi:NADPH:quinone reductase-like Zn-dependent oxidoreductase